MRVINGIVGFVVGAIVLIAIVLFFPNWFFKPATTKVVSKTAVANRTTPNRNAGLCEKQRKEVEEMVKKHLPKTAEAEAKNIEIHNNSSAVINNAPAVPQPSVPAVQGPTVAYGPSFEPPVVFVPPVPQDWGYGGAPFNGRQNWGRGGYGGNYGYRGGGNYRGGQQHYRPQVHTRSAPQQRSAPPQVRTR